MLTTLSARAWHVDAYRTMLSDNLCLEALDRATQVPGVDNLVEVPGSRNASVGSSAEELKFLCDLYDQVWPELAETLEQRRKDQVFVDQRVDAHARLPDYVKQGARSWTAVYGKLDESARVVFGPRASANYLSPNGTKILTVRDREAFSGAFGDIARLPGIEVPNTRYFYRSNPVPSHLLYFVRQLFKAKKSSGTGVHNEVMFSFVLRGVESEEEAKYWKLVIERAEVQLRALSNEAYMLGTIRVIVRFDNVRSIFRINEIADELYPHFAGGTTDADNYFASATRLMRGAVDHVVPPGGAAEGANSMAIVEGALSHVIGAKGGLYFGSLQEPASSVNPENLICANGTVGEADVRDSMFQMLQALAALLASQNAPQSKTMGVLERARWTIWHAVRHRTIDACDALRIAFEECRFIKKDYDLLDGASAEKRVSVRWEESGTGKWYPVAMFLTCKMVTDASPAEWASELTRAFSIESVYGAADPLKKARAIDTLKFRYDTHFLDKFCYFFERCGCQRFAEKVGRMFSVDLGVVQRDIFSFTLDEVIEAASFHGNIGEGKKTLDKMAAGEQALVLQEEESMRARLLDASQVYLNKYGVKFLVSAKGKTGKELLEVLLARSNNSPEKELQNAREALWQITEKRAREEPADTLLKKLEVLRAKHNVKSASVCVSTPSQNPQSFCSGESKQNGAKATAKTLYEIASLSKTIGTAFAIGYFKKRKIPLDSSANQVLEQCGSTLRLQHATNADYGDQVNLTHLMSHCALNMHYVNGVPLDEDMPNVQDFLEGNERYGYPPVEVLGEPGKEFHYSGGGFLVLQHIIEMMEGKKAIEKIMEPFLDQLGISNEELTFEPKPDQRIDVAQGFDDKGNMIVGGRKMFPGYAAGAVGTPAAVMKVLEHLSIAFSDINGSGPISHDTAVTMLHGSDKGCKKFMGCKMGVGVFVMEARRNRFALHQGANDGYRGMFLYCFSGPDKGAGIAIFANGDNRAMMMISEMTQCILNEMLLEGVDVSKFSESFSFDQIKQEEIVNFGYKKMVFDAFREDLPDIIAPPLFTSRSYDQPAPLDRLSRYNGAIGARLVSTTNQGFAQASNLVLPFVPMFDETLFGPHGKVMDSWESVRHNPKEYERAVFELRSPMNNIAYLSLSTKWHFGNQVKFAQVFGSENLDEEEWVPLMDKANLSGHAEVRLEALGTGGRTIRFLKVHGYPDGGLSRIGVYADGAISDETVLSTFDGNSVPFPDKIPQTVKPMSIEFDMTPAEVEANFKKLGAGQEYNVASTTYGGSIVSVTNEHYGSSSQTLSPFVPLSMFDGFESARSHSRTHVEKMVLKLGRASNIHRIEVDFTFFVHNNPVDMQIFGSETNDGDENSWTSLTAKTPTKAFRGNTKAFDVSEFSDRKIQFIKLIIYPDGGFNRIRVMTRA
jgi:allantoicase